MELANPWTEVGTLGQIESLLQDYPLLTHEFGVMYNTALGSIHKVVFSSWNRGARISTADEYPQGDDPHDMTYGTTVFTKGLDQNEHWIQHYYQQGRTTGRSNGAQDDVRVFAVKLDNPWTEAGTLGRLARSAWSEGLRSLTKKTA